MAANDYLSQDEINALLLNSGEKNEHISSDSVFDHHEIIQQFPMLETINERFSGFFQLALSGLIGTTTEIHTDKLQARRFSDYAHSLFIPTSMNVVRINPVDNIGLFVFDPKLVFLLVDKYFGGEGRLTSVNKGREFAPTELRLIQMILEKLFVTLMEAWAPITALDLQFIESEVDPQLTNVLEDDEIVIVSTFHVQIDKCEGDLHITFPHSTLEALRNLSGVRA